MGKDNGWDKSSIGLLVVVPLVIIGLFVVLSSIVIVGAGERGVLLRWGAVTGTVFDEGLSFKIPIMDSVSIMDVKTQKMETTASAASKDLQTVTSKIALNYALKPQSVAFIRQTVGMNYVQTLIDPAIQEAIKSSTAKYTAEELITNRSAAREDMKAQLRNKLNEVSTNSIDVIEFNILDFEFSTDFNAAIEAKVTAQQSALAAENKLKQVEFEAQQRVAQAGGEANAIKIQSQALEQNPNYLQLAWINKWNGNLPNVVAGNNGILLNLPLTNSS